MPEESGSVIICRCEEVTRDEVEQAIRDGATSIPGIKKRTHAGMGLCQGRTCRKLIAAILAGDQDPTGLLPFTVRPPVRAVKIGDIASGDDE